MWTCGMDMAMQQASPASTSSACSIAGERPACPEGCALPLGDSLRTALDRWRSIRQSGSMAIVQTMPTVMWVWRQPTLSIICSRIGGQTAPAKIIATGDNADRHAAMALEP